MTIPKISVDRITIEQLYRRNKDYLVPIIIIIVCFILLIEVTIPQIGSLSVREQEYSAEKKKLDTLNNNLAILDKLSDSALSYQLSIVTNALPSDKNFAAILNGVNYAANKSGVFLGDYDFSVGSNNRIAPGQLFPSLQFSLSVNGGISPTARYITELAKSLPLSEITSIQITKNSSKVDVSFYYLPFNQLKDNYQPVLSLSKNYIDILKNLGTWNNPNIGPALSASKSATQSPF